MAAAISKDSNNTNVPIPLSTNAELSPSIKASVSISGDIANSYIEEIEREKKQILQGKTTKLPFTPNSLNMLVRRYIRTTHEGKVLETPEEMFDRVAVTLANVEKNYGYDEKLIEQYRQEFYEIMSSFKFTPAGRTLANAGWKRIVANCIVLHIEDTMEDIFNTLRDAALLQQAGSGLGFPLHLMRPAGSITKASHGVSSGPISFLHVYNTAFGVIKQQGRHGANMAVMRVDHPDVLEFLECKKVEGSISNFNISVGLTDEFMKQVRENNSKPWMCNFNGVDMLPREIKRSSNLSFVSATPVTLTARQLFMKLVENAWRNGEPGVVFIDTVNNKNPLPGLGRIEASNPCSEQFLHDGDVCNLGSINLEHFVTEDREIDEQELIRVTTIATKMLDNVIDISDFPAERVNKAARGNRRIGLGIMGFADMLVKMRVGYNTEKGRNTAKRVMEVIQQASEKESNRLAEVKGVFPNWEKSVFYPNTKRRNAALTNVAPTGAIAMMFDVSGGIEPFFSLAYYYKNILGGSVQLRYVNKHLETALREANVYNDELIADIILKGSLQHRTELPDWIRSTFVTSMDISAEDHVLMQASFQAEIDNAISKTINFKNTATRQDIFNGYMLAWEKGCKGCTVYRDGSRMEQVLNLNSSTADKKEDKKEIQLSKSVDSGMEQKKKNVQGDSNSEGEENKDKCSDCKVIMIRREGCMECPSCGTSKCNL